MLRKIFILTLAIGFPALIIAQGFYGRNNWKNRKHEFAIGGGAAGFLGDLGWSKHTGNGQDGFRNTPLTPFDYDFQTTKYALTFEYMQRIGSKASLRTNIIWGQVSGDDQYSRHTGRASRAAKFNSAIWEMSQIYILHFNREQIGHLYSLRNTSGKKLGISPFKIGTYIFAGVGATHFNPYADGVRLKPLGTSGQNVEGSGLDPYGLWAVNFPIGFGARHSLNGSTGVKIEFGYRFTTSDWIDDVAKVPYFDRNAVGDAYNSSVTGTDNAAYLYAQPGEQHSNDGGRGDADNDGYMFLMATFYFNRDPRHWFNQARRKPVKVRRPRASF